MAQSLTSDVWCTSSHNSSNSDPIPTKLATHFTDHPINDLPKSQRPALHTKKANVTCSFRLHGIPHVAIEIIIAGQEEPSRLAEGDTGDAANDIIVTVHGQFLIGPDIEQATGSVVTARRERKPVREECDGVYVRLVSGKRLLADALSDVPQLGRGVARPRHERTHIGRQRQGHDVTGVPQKRRHLLSRLDVPQGAAHVPRTGHDLVVVQEAAARQIARMAGQFPADPHVSFARLQAVDGADVVQTAARHVTAGWCVSARHHPRGPQRDGVNLWRLKNKNKHNSNKNHNNGDVPTLLVVCESQTMSLPSWEAETRLRESEPQCIA